MPYTAKQEKFFRAVEHGWKPPAAMHSKLSAGKAKELLSHVGKKKKSKMTASAQAEALRG